MEALKIYGNLRENPIDEIKATIDIFRNQLDLINKLLVDFDCSKYFTGSALERLVCIGNCAEYVQLSKETTQRFMLLSIKMKNAYELASASGELTQEEIAYAHFYMAVRSVIYKQTKPDVPDTEVMDKRVEEMVKNALSCTGVENIVNPEKEIDIFSEDFLKELDKVKMPISKFNALLKLLKKAISEYGKFNKIKSLEFNEMLKRVIDKYNSRDNYTFTSKVVEDFVDDLSEELINILNKLKEDKITDKKFACLICCYAMYEA